MSGAYERLPIGETSTRALALLRVSLVDKFFAVLSRVLGRAMSLPPALDRRVTVGRGVQVPMDDGVALVADVYSPAGDGPHPTILVRSPYGRGGPLGLLLGRVFAERGYRVIIHSCSGPLLCGACFAATFHQRHD